MRCSNMVLRCGFGLVVVWPGNAVRTSQTHPQEVGVDLSDYDIVVVGEQHLASIDVQVSQPSVLSVAHNTRALGCLELEAEFAVIKMLVQHHQVGGALLISFSVAFHPQLRCVLELPQASQHLCLGVDLPY